MFNIQEQRYFDAGIMPFTFHQTESEESYSYTTKVEVGKEETVEVTITHSELRKVVVKDTVRRVKYYAPGMIVSIVELLKCPAGSGYNPLRSGKTEVHVDTDIETKKITGKSGGWYGPHKMCDTFEEAMEYAKGFVKEFSEMAEDGFVEKSTIFKGDEEINRQPIEDVFGIEVADKWEAACIKAKMSRKAEDKYLEKLRAVFHNHFGETRHFKHYCFEFMSFLRDIDKKKDDLTAFELKLIRKLSKVTWRR